MIKNNHAILRLILWGLTLTILGSTFVPAQSAKADDREWVTVQVETLWVAQAGDITNWNGGNEFKFYIVALHEASEKGILSTFPEEGVLHINPNEKGWYVATPENLSVVLPVPLGVNHVTLYITAVDSDLLASELGDSALADALNTIAPQGLRSILIELIRKIPVRNRTVERFLRSALASNVAGLIIEGLMEEDEVGVIQLDLYRSNGWKALGYPNAWADGDPEMVIQYEVRISLPTNDPPDQGQLPVGPQDPAEGQASDSSLLSSLDSQLSASRVNNPYITERKKFAQVLVKHVNDYASGAAGISLLQYNDALFSADVGDRINGLVNEVWSDWLGRVNQHQIDPFTDPAPYGFSPFRQLTIRMIQGRQGSLSGQEQCALYNFLTRPEDSSAWNNSMDGVIAAVNRMCFQ